MEIPTSIRTKIAALVISAAGITGISQYEGFSEKAYVPVPGDVVTIGHGTTRHPDGTPIRMGEKITRATAEEYLKIDIHRFQSKMQECVKVDLSQNEFDAYISLEYNIGPSAFCGSSLVKKLNTYDYAGACKEILKWDKFQGNPLPGLTKRRQKEYTLCIGSQK